MSKLKAMAAAYLGVLALAAVIFVAGGRLLYWQALLYVAIALIGVATSQALAPRDSDLAVERAAKASAGEEWDRRILGRQFLASMLMFVVAGLDSGRFQWTGAVPMPVTAAGVVLMLVGQTVFALARRQNPFFSSTYRIQTERGHTVCDAGLYRCVRHPGYLGLLLALLGFPFVLGSSWALLPALIAAAFLVKRTRLEDEALARELPGYPEYAAKTRRRLLPGLY